MTYPLGLVESLKATSSLDHEEYFKGYYAELVVQDGRRLVWPHWDDNTTAFNRGIYNSELYVMPVRMSSTLEKYEDGQSTTGLTMLEGLEYAEDLDGRNTESSNAAANIEQITGEGSHDVIEALILQRTGQKGQYRRVGLVQARISEDQKTLLGTARNQVLDERFYEKCVEKYHQYEITII